MLANHLKIVIEEYPCAGTGDSAVPKRELDLLSQTFRRHTLVHKMSMWYLQNHMREMRQLSAQIRVPYPSLSQTHLLLALVSVN